MQPIQSSSARNNRQWEPATSPEEAARRASGRRRYNNRRQVKALLRRRRIIHIWDERSQHGWSMFTRGSQSQLAEMMGVHRSTISRDLKAILARNYIGACPTCDSDLTMARMEALEAKGKIKVTRRA